MSTPIVTIRNPELSRWQSAVEYALRQEFPDLHISEIRRLPTMQGVYQHVRAVASGQTIPQPAVESADSVEFNAYASQQFFKVAAELEPGLNYTPDLILASVDDWPYSTANLHNWLWEAYKQYFQAIYLGKSNMYRDPVDNNGNIAEGKSVIPWKMPANGKIIILGDWGTSCLDAQDLLSKLIDECGSTPPDCIIHLGDIYYSGTKSECDTNFYDIIRTTLKYTGPVFTIPGNHEYYDFGNGFFYLIDKLNSDVPGSVSAKQAASYFCLRTSDNKWQFLGLDTGYNDSDNATTLVAPPAPDLKSSLDVQWAQDKLDNFDGQTIMLSHHQLFTRSSGDMHSSPFGGSCANPYLYSYFGKYLQNKISAWFWGHEHSFALFENGLMGLNMGRLIGSSSYEEAKSDNPYADNFPLIPYNSNNVKVAPNAYTPTKHDSDQYYPHVGAILQMNGSDAPTISYYSFPSWDKEYNAPSTNFKLTPVVKETITNPKALPTGLWKKNNSKSYDTDFGPAAAAIGDSLYLAFAYNGDSDKIYWDNASYDGSKLTKNKASAIKSSVKTDKNPAMVNFNGKLIMVYKQSKATDLYWCVYDPTTKAWTVEGRLEDAISGSPNIQSNYGPALTVFNGKVYLLYLRDGDDSTIKWATYDGTTWTDHGTKSVGGTDLTSANKVCPALAANSDTLFIVVSNGSSLTLVTGDKKDNWTSQGTICNDITDADNVPTTKKGLALCANSKFVELFYVDGSGYICWAIYDLTGTKNWTGGIRTIVNPGSLPQTGDVPCVLQNDSNVLLLYRGSDNRNLFYSTRDIYG